MIKSFKKSLSFLLAILMLAGVFAAVPLSAQAEDVITIVLNDDNASVDWVDSCADESWWQMAAESDDYSIILCNENCDSAPGSYTTDDMCIDLCSLIDVKSGGEPLTLVDCACVVTVDGEYANISGVFTFSDEKTYNISISKGTPPATEPATAEPTTEETVPATDPTEPTTEATEPTTEATEPTTEEPTTEATIPTTEEPTTEATIPTTEEPTTEPTEPTTQIATNAPATFNPAIEPETHSPTIPSETAPYTAPVTYFPTIPPLTAPRPTRATQAPTTEPVTQIATNAPATFNPAIEPETHSPTIPSETAPYIVPATMPPITQPETMPLITVPVTMLPTTQPATQAPITQPATQAPTAAPVTEPKEEPLPSPDINAPKKVVVNKITVGSSGNTIIVDFDAVKSATDYQVAYKLQSASKWKFDKTCGMTKYTIKNLKKDNAYDVKVRALNEKAGKWSAAKRAFTSVMKKPKCKGVKGGIKVSWTKKDKASGYQIWCSGKKNMSDKKSFTVVKSTHYTIKGLKKGKKYYIQIRSYRAVKSAKYLGRFTKAKATTAK